MSGSCIKGLCVLRCGRGLALEKLLSSTRGNSNNGNQQRDQDGTKEVHLDVFFRPLSLVSDEMPERLPADGCTLVQKCLFAASSSLLDTT